MGCDMTIDEMIAVLQAAKEGKNIEFSHYSGRRDGENIGRSCAKSPEWRRAFTPTWNFHKYEYRVKPEPQRLWANECASGCMTFFDSKSEAEAWALKNPAVRAAVEYVEVIK